jgi:hypothetical protein
VLRRRRDLLLLAAFATCAAAAALLQAPVDTALPFAANAEPAAAAPPLPDDVAAAPATAPIAGPAAATTDGPTVDTRGWTSGIVRGDIQLAVSVLDRIQSITVEVVEARQAYDRDGAVRWPTRLSVTVERGRGTPTFEVRDIPFSEHPYFVMVRSPGLNGSRAVVPIDAAHPLHDDLVLAITPGAVLSILARDQDATPYVGLDVALSPIGDPPARPPYAGKTDNFGSLVLPDVLAGEYELRALLGGRLATVPERITVHPGGAMSPRGQSHKLLIERGVAVEVAVGNRAGFPLPGTTVTATATDRIKHTVREAQADDLGIARLPLLPAGTWHLTVARDGFHLWDRHVTLTAFQDPLALEARLVPIAR